MPQNDIQQVLSDAIDRNAASVFATGSKEAMLKKWTMTESVTIEGINQMWLREAIMKTGEILEEDENNGIITAVIPSGSMNASRALVVVRSVGNTVEFAAFFKEGFIRQNGAKQAFRQSTTTEQQ